MKKLIVLSAAVSILAGATAEAAAGPADPISRCQSTPVTTPGITVLGQRVPSVGDVSVCVVSATIADAVPVLVDQPECGSPCFTVEIDGLEVSEDLTVTVDLKLDGQLQHISYTPGKIAVDPAPESRLCVVGVGTPDPCTDRVTTPGNLSAASRTRRGSGRISLGWSASRSTGRSEIAGYQVWRSTTGEPGSFEQIGSAAPTSYSDTSVQPGQTYWYYVVAWDAQGRFSPASNTASATAR